MQYLTPDGLKARNDLIVVVDSQTSYIEKLIEAAASQGLETEIFRAFTSGYRLEASFGAEQLVKAAALICDFDGDYWSENGPLPLFVQMRREFQYQPPLIVNANALLDRLHPTFTYWQIQIANRSSPISVVNILKMDGVLK